MKKMLTVVLFTLMLVLPAGCNSEDNTPGDVPPIVVDPVGDLETSFQVITTGGAGENLITGNSLAWIKDAKDDSKVVFYISSTVYPTGSTDDSGMPFRPQAGDTIVVIGNTPEKSVEVKIPANTTAGAGRSIILEIPLEEALELIGDADSLKVDVRYGRVNACELMEPKRYKVPYSENAQRLMNYFRDIYGEKIVSGMMDQSWEDSTAGRDQTKLVFDATGKWPALKGFDFLMHRTEATGAIVPDGMRQQTEEAVKWWNGIDRHDRQWVELYPEKDDLHGIVCFCWHWRGSEGGFYSDSSTGGTYDGSGKKTALKIPMFEGKLNKGHPNFDYIKGELDRVVVELKILREEGVPVIWRPMHEALGNWGRGGWFWWGIPGTDGSPAAYAFKALWEYLYDYLTIRNGLDNLIWLCNPQGPDSDYNWVPDLKTIDLVGYDPYVGNDDSQLSFFKGTQAMDPSGNTMVTMSENGRIPDPDKCYADNAMWLFFMIWNGMVSGSGTGHYANSRVVDLLSLPDLTAYRLE